MDIAYVKDFLKVDFTDDDNYIKLLCDVAKQYVINAIGKCDEENPLVKLLMLVIISTLYENREYTVDTANEKVQRTLRSMVLQLQLDEVSGDE